MTTGASKACRDTLTTVLDVCHRAVMTPEIGAEWKRHTSRFARTWRRQMEARKKIHRMGACTDTKLRNATESVFDVRGHADAALKDVHLAEAALAADQIVLPLDERVRTLFRKASETIAAYRQVVWANPSKPEENVVAWLTEGAKADAGRKLGAN